MVLVRTITNEIVTDQPKLNMMQPTAIMDHFHSLFGF